ncbi:MAG: response regulator transcription factor [Chitinophagaceae bacterium]
MAKIALVDDHILMRRGLAELVTSFKHEVIIEADNGQDLINKLNTKNFPDLVMLDINMPIMDGYALASWLKENHPTLKILILSMFDDDISVIRMLRLGAKGFVLKDCEPSDLRKAIEGLLLKGYYHSEIVSNILLQNISDKNHGTIWALSDKELQFLELACSEMTYKQIAIKMHVSTRTVDDYRDELYRKLNIRSRVGLVIFAVRQGLCKI